MSKILLVTGSVFGAALLTADEIETALSEASHEVVRPDPVPDDLLPLYTGLGTEYPRITHLSYLVVALGDSSYDYFCGGGKTMDEAIADLGATQIEPPLTLDALEITEPEEVAPEWVVNAINEYNSSKVNS